MIQGHCSFQGNDCLVLGVDDIDIEQLGPKARKMIELDGQNIDRFI